MENRGFHDYTVSEEIKKALKGLAYELPTKVQEQVIPLALDKKNLIVKAQTGSGKTAAFAIPICEVIQWLENKPQALILTPTRELAVQVEEDVTNIGRLKRVKAAAIYGGHPFAMEKAQLKQKTHVVVGTPGRVMDHIKRGTLTLDKVQFVVIDEADRMLDMGFLEQVQFILDKLPMQRTTLLFSATMPDEMKVISGAYMQDASYIDVSQADITADGIRHTIYFSEEEEKFELLMDVTITEQPDSCIIFCNTKDGVDMLQSRLAGQGYRCTKIHGDMEQDDRLISMKRFQRGVFSYLAATDVAARGIDTGHISLIINYDIPYDKEGYVHRTGRTGRAGQKGKAITFVTSAQLRYLKNIEAYIGFELDQMTRPSAEEVALCKTSFDEKRKETPILRPEKGDELNKDIMKLRFNAGKKKKLRAANFVGVISNIEGVTAEDIGAITILDTLTYIEILNNKGTLVLETMKNTRIGNKQLKVTQAMDKRD